jgi:exosome complex RNA-binding protein Csl4
MINIRLSNSLALAVVFVLSSITLNACGGKSGSRKAEQPAPVDSTKVLWEGYKKIRDEQISSAQGLSQANLNLNVARASWLEIDHERLVYARNPGRESLLEAEAGLENLKLKSLKAGSDVLGDQLVQRSKAEEVIVALTKLVTDNGGQAHPALKSHVETVIASLQDSQTAQNKFRDRFSDFHQEFDRILVSTLRITFIDSVVHSTATTTSDLKLVEQLSSLRNSAPAVENSATIPELDAEIRDDIANHGQAVVQANLQIQSELEFIRTEFSKWFVKEFPQ